MCVREREGESEREREEREEGEREKKFFFLFGSIYLPFFDKNLDQSFAEKATTFECVACSMDSYNRSIML